MTAALSAARLACLLLAGVLPWAGLADAAVPPVGYQGELALDGVPVSGEARFKFVLLRSGTTLWSNDGTSVAGAEPTGSVRVPVEAGIFSVHLGGTGMEELPEGLFATDSDAPLFLRTWVDAGDGFEQLSDQVVSAALLALGSETARRAEGDFDISGDAVVGGTLDVTGNAVVGGTLDVTDDTTVGGDLDVTGGAAVGTDLDVAGRVTVGEVLVAAGVRLSAGALTFADGTSLSTAPVGGGGGGIAAIRSGDGALAVTDPNGPTVTIDVQAGGIDSEHVADGAIAARHLAEGAVSSAAIADAAVASSAIAPDAVTATHVADDAIGTEHVADGTLVDADVAAGAAIAESKLALAFPTHSSANDPTAAEKGALVGSHGTPGADNPYVTSSDPRLTGDGGGDGGVPSVNGITGPVTIRGEGGTVVSTVEDTIVILSASEGGSGVQSVQNADGTIAVTNPVGPAVTVGVAPLGIGTAQLAANAVTSAKVADGSLANADVATNAAIAESKLALAFPTHSNANDPDTGEKAALAGTSGTPGSGNRYVTAADARLTDPREPTGPAGGDLSGNYPSPLVGRLWGRAVSATQPTSGQVLGWNGSSWTPTTIAGGGGGDSPWEAGTGSIYYDGGNVGVGLSTPQNRVHLHNSDVFFGSPSNLQITNASTGTTANDGLQLTVNSTIADYGLIGGLRFNENRPLGFGTNSTYHMFLREAGTLGLGTFTPAAKLEVFHSSSEATPHLTLAQAGEGFGRLKFRTDAIAGKHWIVAGRTHADDASSQFNFWYQNGTSGQDILSINGNGRVGIGTTSPQRTLEVHMNNANSTTGNALISQAGSGDAWLNVGLTNGTHYAIGVDNSDGDKLKIGYNATQAGGVAENTRMTIDTAGNVQAAGEIQRAATGNANLVPIAYGTVDNDGTLIAGGSGNFSVVRSNVGRYDITITGENYNIFQYVAVASLFSLTDDPAVVTHGFVDDELRVETYTLGPVTSREDRAFSFVVYKP